MPRTFLCFLLVGLAGCPATPAPVAKKPPVAVGGGNPVVAKNGDSTPPRTFTPAEDKAVAALKDSSVEELIKLLGQADQRDVASRALAARGDESAAALVEALKSSDAQVRSAAAFTLGKIRSASAVAPLTAVAEKDDVELVRDAARFALDAIAEK